MKLTKEQRKLIKKIDLIVNDSWLKPLFPRGYGMNSMGEVIWKRIKLRLKQEK